MENSLVVLVLIAVNVFQFIYWSTQIHRLVDKLMSRTYYEYKQAAILAPEPKQPKIQVTPHDVEDFGVLEGIGLNA